MSSDESKTEEARCRRTINANPLSSARNRETSYEAETESLLERNKPRSILPRCRKAPRAPSPPLARPALPRIYNIYLP
jgi:hypothetical protein